MWDILVGTGVPDGPLAIVRVLRTVREACPYEMYWAVPTGRYLPVGYLFYFARFSGRRMK